MDTPDRDNGELESEKPLGRSDQVYFRLKELIARERGGWTKSFVSYKTGRYVFRGTSLKVSCYKNMLVIDYTGEGKPQSFSKQIPNVLEALALPAK